MRRECNGDLRVFDNGLDALLGSSERLSTTIPEIIRKILPCSLVTRATAAEHIVQVLELESGTHVASSVTIRESPALRHRGEKWILIDVSPPFIEAVARASRPFCARATIHRNAEGTFREVCSNTCLLRAFARSRTRFILRLLARRLTFAVSPCLTWKTRRN